MKRSRNLDDGLRRLNRRLGLFVQDGTGPAAKGFAALGLETDIATGKLRGTEAVFDAVVRRLESVESKSRRAAIASQLFGEDAGPRLALLLSKGTQGVSDLEQEARNLGLVLDDELLRNAEEVNDQFDILAKTIDVHFKGALLAIGPEIAAVTGALSELFQGLKQFEVGDIAGRSLSSLRSELDRTFEEIEKQRAVMAKVEAEIANQDNEGQRQRSENQLRIMRRRLHELLGDVVRLQARIGELDQAKLATADTPFVSDKAKEDLKETSGLVENMAKTLRKFDEQLRKDGERIRRSVLTPLEEYNERLEKLDKLLKAGAISQETHSRAVAQAGAEFNKATSPVDKFDRELRDANDAAKDLERTAGDLGDAIGTAFEDAILSGEGLRGVLQGLAEDIGRIILRASVTKPLERFITSSMTSSGSGAGGFSLPFSSSINAFGAKHLGFSSGEIEPGTGFRSVGTLGTKATLGNFMAGVGTGMATGAMVNNLAGGNQTGGQIGSAVGAMAGAAIGSAFGPVGTVIGGAIGGAAGGGIGGLFGGGPSVGPIGHTNIGRRGNRLFVGTTGVDNGARAEATIQASRDAVRSINRLAEEFDLRIRNAGAGRISQGAARGPQSARGFIEQFLAGGGFTSSSAPVRRALAMSHPGNIEQNLTAVTNLLEIIDNLETDPEELSQVEAALQNINDQFEELSKGARRFGISTAKIVRARDTAEQRLLEDFSEGVDRQIMTFTDPAQLAMDELAERQKQRFEDAKLLGADIVDVERLHMLERKQLMEELGRASQIANENLRQFLNSLMGGPSSPLAPRDVLANAEARFNKLREAALGGDAEARQKLAAAASNLLAATEAVFGRAPQFFERFNFVVRTLENLLTDVPQFATGTSSAARGLALVGEAGPELVSFRGGESVIPFSGGIGGLMSFGGDDGDVARAVERSTEAISQGNVAAVDVLERVFMELEGMHEEFKLVRRELQDAKPVSRPSQAPLRRTA